VYNKRLVGGTVVQVTNASFTLVPKATAHAVDLESDLRMLIKLERQCHNKLFILSNHNNLRLHSFRIKITDLNILNSESS
jgi:hypothetical protein